MIDLQKLEERIAHGWPVPPDVILELVKMVRHERHANALLHAATTSLSYDLEMSRLGAGDLQTMISMLRAALDFTTTQLIGAADFGGTSTDDYNIRARARDYRKDFVLTDEFARSEGRGTSKGQGLPLLCVFPVVNLDRNDE